jgi:hypothetical protein
MPHACSDLVAQLQENLTEQRYHPVVVHNYCRRRQAKIGDFPRAREEPYEPTPSGKKTLAALGTRYKRCH